MQKLGLKNVKLHSFSAETKAENPETEEGNLPSWYLVNGFGLLVNETIYTNQR